MTSSPSRGATDTPVFGLLVMSTLGFKSQGEFPHLHALSPVFNRIPRFTSAATPADLMVASMAAEPFSSIYLLKKHLLGSRLGPIMHVVASQYKTR